MQGLNLKTVHIQTSTNGVLLYIHIANDIAEQRYDTIRYDKINYKLLRLLIWLVCKEATAMNVTIE